MSWSDAEIANLVEEITPPADVGAVSVTEHRERTATWIALSLVAVYVVCIMGTVIRGWAVLDGTSDGGFSQAIELLQALSAVLSGPIGVVLGFYFRTTDEG